MVHAGKYTICGEFVEKGLPGRVVVNYLNAVLGKKFRHQQRLEWMEYRRDAAWRSANEISRGQFRLDLSSKIQCADALRSWGKAPRSIIVLRIEPQQRWIGLTCLRYFRLICCTPETSISGKPKRSRCSLSMTRSYAAICPLKDRWCATRFCSARIQPGQRRSFW